MVADRHVGRTYLTGPHRAPVEVEAPKRLPGQGVGPHMGFACADPHPPTAGRGNRQNPETQPSGRRNRRGRQNSAVSLGGVA